MEKWDWQQVKDGCICLLLLIGLALVIGGFVIYELVKNPHPFGG